MSHRSLRYYAESYARVTKFFRSGPLLCWRHHRRQDVAEAAFWNGRRIRNPPNRSGLAETIVEMWGMEVYTARGFYDPAPGDVVFDIGANIGAFSLWVAQRSPGTRVLAYEPSAENLSTLSVNLAGWPHGVRPIQQAISGSAGRVMVVDGGSRSLDHRVERIDTNEPNIQTIEARTLGAILQDAQVERVDMLKMDIEGSEHDVFQTLEPDTQRRFARIAIEYHDNIRPGTKSLVIQRLLRTHDIESIEGSADGYGIIRAVLI